MVTADDRRIAEQLKGEGNIFFAKGKYDAAAEKYTEALTMWPDWIVPLINRATCHKKKEKWKEVEADCRKALSLNGGAMKAHYFLGQALEKQCAYGEAIKHLAKALEAAREQDDQIKDEIWRELARVKYSKWKVESEERKAEHAILQGQLMEMLQERHSKEIRNAMDPDHTRARHKKEISSWGRLFELAAHLDNPVEISSAFTCQLTMEVFREPVMTPSGMSYEKSSLMEHLQKVGKFDPVTRTPVTDSQILPNLGLRTATHEYLNEHPWAWHDCL